jgi:hypothetical protein
MLALVVAEVVCDHRICERPEVLAQRDKADPPR